MEVSVYKDETLIGVATLESLDPPMGVAFGPFTPSSSYDPEKHANIIECEYTDDKGQSLWVRSDEIGLLNVASIVIEDWSSADLGRQLTVWFQDGQDFAAIFSSHKDYRAYYPE